MSLKSILFSIILGMVLAAGFDTSKAKFLVANVENERAVLRTNMRIADTPASDEKIRFKKEVNDDGRQIQIEGFRVCAGLSVAVLYSNDDFDEANTLSDECEKLACDMISTLISKRRFEIDSNSDTLRNLREKLGKQASKQELMEFLRLLKAPG